MITYFDTSALVPLIVDESSSVVCERLWLESSRVLSSRLVYVEAKAALVKALRMGRISSRQLNSANLILGDLVAGLDYVEFSSVVAGSAGDLSQEYDLRGYDAVHLASALLVNDSQLVFATGDQNLAEAALKVGISTANTMK